MLKERLGRFSIQIRKIVRRTSPERAILISFFLLVVLGTFLLSLPISTTSGESAGLITALFTTTSAVCVTGLVVVETAAYWSIFGKIVIICLIQIGGLGLISILSVLVVFTGEKITLKDRILIQRSLNQESLSGILRLLKTVIFGTLLVEGVAALILTIRFLFVPGVNPLQALAYGIFHAISAFCNAGFDILGHNSLADYVGDPIVNIVIMSMIVLGGLGFCVWADFLYKVKHRPFSRSFTPKTFFRTLSLHSKIAISSTIVLIVGGAVFFFFAEFHNPTTMGELTLWESIWAAFFHSVTLRTAGFFTINQGGLTQASRFVSVLLMAIGGSPSGTAGGIKTVTLGVIIFSAISAFKGKKSTSTFGRKISVTTVLKSLSIVALFLTIIFTATIILTFTEGDSFTFLDLLFEVVSASATVGLTVGITPSISTAGQIVLVICMFLGRTGAATVFIALNRKSQTTSNLDYPEEKVIIG